MLVGQVLSSLFIVILGFISFYKSDFHFELRTLIKVSILTLLSVILALFSWMIPIMGFPAVKVGLSQLPLILVGYLFGLPYAFIAGLSSDIIELLTGSIVTPFFGFTLNKILVAMIPAFWVKWSKKDKPIYFLLSLSLILTAALVYVFSLNTVKIGDELQSVSLISKSVIAFGMLSLSLALSYLVLKFKDSYQDLKVIVFAQSVLWVEVIVNLSLTPIWLYAIYGLPIELSVMVRLIKTVLMIPLNFIVGLSLLRLLTKLKV